MIFSALGTDEPIDTTPRTVTLAEYLMNLEKRLQVEANTQTQSLQNALSSFGNSVKTDFANMGRSIVTMHQVMQESIKHVNQRLDQFSNPSMACNNSCSSTSLPNNTSANTTIFYTQPPTIPKFQGNKTKHAMKFLEELEIYFRKSNTPLEQRLLAIQECFEDSAGDWYTIYRISWQTYEDFKQDFIHCYWSKVEQDQLRNKLSADIWENTTSMLDHFSKYVGLARLLTEPLSEENLVSQLIKHFPANIQSLWLLKNDRTVAGTADFLRQQESVLYRPQPQAQPAADVPQVGNDRYHPYNQNKTWIRKTKKTNHNTNQGNPAKINKPENSGLLN